MFDTYGVLQSILEYFKVALGDKVAETGLAAIEEWDIGYRDIASGLHAHPAFLVKSDRDYESSDGTFFQTMETDIALVFRCEDSDEGYRRLCSYQAVLDSILRDDPHFGGNVAEVKKATFTKARDSSRTLFFLFVEAEIDIDVLSWRNG
jgi:hypothetical protein